MARNIGLANVPIPSDTCEDPNCPFHGKLSIRGQVLDGVVIGSKMDKTVVIERTHERKIFKYERYEKRSSRIHAHNPPCLNAKEGDTVRIAECRPLSKTKSFVVVSIT